MELIEYKRPEKLDGRSKGQAIVTVNKSKLSIYKALVEQLKIEIGTKFKVLFDKEGNAYLEFLAAGATATNFYTLYLPSKSAKGLNTKITDLVVDKKIQDNSIYLLEEVKTEERTLYKMVYKGETIPQKSRKPNLPEGE